MAAQAGNGKPCGRRRCDSPPRDPRQAASQSASRSDNNSQRQRLVRGLLSFSRRNKFDFYPKSVRWAGLDSSKYVRLFIEAYRITYMLMVIREIAYMVKNAEIKTAVRWVGRGGGGL